ncbi:apolipoprotein D-like [Anastrepha obliqua]|uniref:apolipoprotein D-like n=1 Tax=Anastrepha obliqua TaxID=95512 RepID=UPI0024094C5C|nr:apolipoprotein D-like [Anastrepha obliqua]
MQKTILAIIALTLCGLANAQVNSDGACPNPPVQSCLSINAYAGFWYEYARYPAAFEGNGTCVTLTYTQKNQNEMSILGTMIDPSTNKTLSLLSDAKQISNAKFNVTTKVATRSPPSLWVLSTDYDNYGINYACLPASGDSHNTFLSIITRSPTPSAATVAKARNVLRSIGFSLAPMTVTDQSNC